VREHVGQDLLLGVLSAIAFKAFAALRGIAGYAATAWPVSFTPLRMQKQCVSRAGLPVTVSYCTSANGNARRGNLEHDRSNRFPFHIVMRHGAFGRCIEFQDARNNKALLKFLPDVSLQSIAAAKLQAMRDRADTPARWRDNGTAHRYIERSCNSRRTRRPKSAARKMSTEPPRTKSAPTATMPRTL
jgi:hypothetical protein